MYPARAATALLVLPAIHRAQWNERYDDIDRLAADVAAAIQSRGDEFEDERQLCSWLEEDHVQYDERSLIAAIRQLESIGRIKRPWQDHDQWISDRSLPGYWIPPKIFDER